MAGIRATLRLMVRIAKQGRQDPKIRFKAEELVRGLPQKAWMQEVEAVHDFVLHHIRYTMDIRDVETVATPDKTLERGVGDCDDKAVLTASLLESIGHPARFVAVGKRPNHFSHVLVETFVGRRWVPVETTENVPVGWYPPGFPFRLVYHV